MSTPRYICGAGIQHRGWYNTDSAWLGPSLRLVMLSKLTVQLARFTRAHMFGPGTACRCATCTQLPASCQWGGGPYAGTLLLYAQEIALNAMWTQREHDFVDQHRAFLDGSTTRPDISICHAGLLHARHNLNTFSKVILLISHSLFSPPASSTPSCGATTATTTCLGWT